MATALDRMKKTEVDLVVFRLGSRGHRVWHWFHNRTAILSPARTGTGSVKSSDVQPCVSLLLCLVSSILIQPSSRV